jgi:hypothetical protein
MMALCVRYDAYLRFLVLFYFPDFSQLTERREESGLNPVGILVTWAAEALADNGETRHTNSHFSLVNNAV